MNLKEWSFNRNFFLFGGLKAIRSRLNSISVSQVILLDECDELLRIVTMLDRFITKYSSKESKKESMAQCKVAAKKKGKEKK